MNLRQLEVFHAVMQAGSVTGAAQLLNVSQPAVSNVLKHMEQQLRFKLFERVRGRLHPTPEAIELFPDVTEIFGRIGTLMRVVQEMRDGRSGRLVLATSPTLVNARRRPQSPSLEYFTVSTSLNPSVAVEFGCCNRIVCPLFASVPTQPPTMSGTLP